MAQPQYGPPTDRWNINLPAVIGVVFVFLVGVIVWVVLSATGDDGDDAATASPASTSATTAVGSTPVTSGTTPPETTTPAPMPDLTTITSVTTDPASSTSAPAETTVPATAPPPTTAPGSPAGTVAGDLGVPGRPMQQPGCDGGFITIIASAVGDQATAVSIGGVLDSYPTSEYLRTDQTCPSLNPAVDGEPIYVVYFGPFQAESDACAARSQGTEGSYAKELANDRPPNHVIDCS